MITGDRDTTTIEDISHDYSPFSNSTGANSFDDVIFKLRERKRNLENGGVNCIPSPFKRFRIEYPGVEQGRYVVVTANQKIGKSKIASYLYIYNVLEYCFEHPEKCSAHIIYFPLEESPELVREKYISYLLFKLDDIRISPEDLRSTSEDYPVPDEILDLLETEKYKKRLDFFDKNIEFRIDDTTPSNILKVCEDYALKNGTVKYKKGTRKEFRSYTPNDPNHYKIMFVDHVSLVESENGMSTKQTVDKISEYCVKHLRNKYGYTCVIVQQQAAEAEGTEAIKQKRIMPSSSTLADSKYTARDADLVLGLFNPNKFGMTNFHGYDITRLGGNARFLQILENRHGNAGSICPLLFDGAVGYFDELPRVDDTNIEGTYKYVENLKRRQNRQTSFQKIKRIMFLIFNKNIQPNG